MAQTKRKLLLYLWTIDLIGASILLVCAYLVIQRSQASLLALLLFSFLVFIAEIVPTRIPNSRLEMTMTMPLAVSLFLIQGLPTCIVFCSMSFFFGNMVTLREAGMRKVIPNALFNTANITIALTVASGAYLLTGGHLITSAESLSYGSMILPLVFWTICYNCVNVVICTACASIYNMQIWRVALYDGLRWTIPNILFGMPVSVLFSSLYFHYGLLGILLLILPCLGVRKAFNVYAEQLDAYRSTITTLGTYMQHYHPYTKGHLERVAQLSEKIARQMNLQTRSLMYIHDAGLLHDIGKVGVKEEILDKVSRLSDEEWNTIKQHPARGAEILSQMKYLQVIVTWVRGHHERPDGKGYPDGLAEEALPIEAAVIAVADAFDAMTGGPDEKDQRVYRTPLTLDQAMDQVRFGAGTQFHPKVVKAFMRVMEQEGEDSGK